MALRGKDNVSQVVGKGGNVTSEEKGNEIIPVLVRIRKDLLKTVDEDVKSNFLKITRSHWISDAIVTKIEQKRKAS